MCFKCCRSRGSGIVLQPLSPLISCPSFLVILNRVPRACHPEGRSQLPHPPGLPLLPPPAPLSAGRRCEASVSAPALTDVYKQIKKLKILIFPLYYLLHGFHISEIGHIIAFLVINRPILLQHNPIIYHLKCQIIFHHL